MPTNTGLLFYRSIDDTTAVVELRFSGGIVIPPLVELNGETWAQHKVYNQEDGSVEILFTPVSSDDPPLVVILDKSS